MKYTLFTFKHVLYCDNGYAIWNVKTGELIYWLNDEDDYLMQITNTPRRRYLREQIALLVPPPREFNALVWPFADEIEYLT